MVRWMGMVAVSFASLGVVGCGSSVKEIEPVKASTDKNKIGRAHV